MVTLEVIRIMGQRIKETKTKRCLYCNKLMKRGYYDESMKLESVRDWNRRKFCSRRCSGLYAWKKCKEEEELDEETLISE